MIYGAVCSYWFPSIKPTLIIDAFPSVTTDNIFNFDHFGVIGTTIPWSAVMIGSLKVAFVAIFETFISAMIAQNKYEQMNEKRAIKAMDFEAPERKREIFAMSLGNVLSGVFGGLPCTGVLVRTAVNIEYGAESRASQLINSGYVLVITLCLLRVFAFMPLPTIAAMLICSAVNLGKASTKILVKFAQNKAWLDFWTLIITAILCFMIDGAIGLLIGLVFRIILKCIKGGFKTEDKDEDFKQI